jgi:hypothetical protein
MNKTVGLKDAKVRTVLGAVAGIVSIVALATGILPVIVSPALGLVSIIMLVTAYTGLCPIYSLAGVQTAN